jgi:hypothetical protein
MAADGPNPFDSLPTELTGVILRRIGGFVPCLRAVCHTWRILTAGFQAHPVLCLAQGGHLELLRWAAAGRLLIPCRTLNALAIEAAVGGHAAIIVQCKEWGATNRDEVLDGAAYYGRENVMHLCKEWGAADFRESLRWAAAGGHLGAMRLCKEWGAPNIEDALYWAARGGHMHAVLLCRAWGAYKYHRAEAVATQYGHTALMRMLAQWREEAIRRRHEAYQTTREHTDPPRRVRWNSLPLIGGGDCGVAVALLDERLTAARTSMGRPVSLAELEHELRQRTAYGPPAGPPAQP